MSTQAAAAAERVRYAILYRLGYWCSLEAECRTSPCAEFNALIDHHVTFVLINKFGDRCQLGFAIITGQTDRSEVFNEDGVDFPDLETAVQAHAADLMRATKMPGRWRDRPARHETWRDTLATAFGPLAVDDPQM
jgi:hypothetical protein